MEWKNWSYARKGGVIVLLLWIAYITLAGLYGIIFLGGNCTPCEKMLGAQCEQKIIDCFTEFSVNYYLPTILFGMTLDDNHVILFIISTIFWFILGALIGYIYGKIKNRNESKGAEK